MRSPQIPIVFFNGSTQTTALPSSGTLTSNIIRISQETGYCVQVYWTGTPTGTFSIQGSNDPGSIQPSGAVVGVTNFTTILNSSTSTGGAAGSLSENIWAAYYRWFQVVYTASSGTGTITSASAVVKGP